MTLHPHGQDRFRDGPLPWRLTRPKSSQTTATRELKTCSFDSSGLAGFPLGRVLASPGVLLALEKAGQQPQEFLDRHASGDWGEVDSHDAEENEISLQNGLRLLSSYTTVTGDRLWIITEADRSATTLLLPEEY